MNFAKFVTLILKEKPLVAGCFFKILFNEYEGCGIKQNLRDPSFILKKICSILGRMNSEKVKNV